MDFNFSKFILVGTASPILTKGLLAGGGPYNLPAATSLTLALVLLVVLVLALAYNGRVYRPPEINPHEADHEQDDNS